MRYLPFVPLFLLTTVTMAETVQPNELGYVLSIMTGGRESQTYSFALIEGKDAYARCKNALAKIKEHLAINFQEGYLNEDRAKCLPFDSTSPSGKP